MSDEKIVRDWFLRLLADFRIYSPLYKVTVSKVDDSYRAEGEVEKGKIRAFFRVVDGKAMCEGGVAAMYWEGEG
jgi:hypothetical protein